MRLILLSNKENFEGVAGTTDEKFSAVNQKNQPWPFRLRQKIAARFVETFDRRTTTLYMFLLANQLFLPATKPNRIS
ncbi:MAG: hypothetical protein ACN2B6_06860 [Rickettsiales bacterium]